MLSPLLLDEPFRPLDAACVALSLAGMSLFFVGKVEAGQLLGNLLGAVSGVVFALALVLLRPHPQGGRGDPLPPLSLRHPPAACVPRPCAATALPPMSTR